MVKTMEKNLKITWLEGGLKRTIYKKTSFTDVASQRYLQTLAETIVIYEYCRKYRKYAEVQILEKMEQELLEKGEIKMCFSFFRLDPFKKPFFENVKISKIQYELLK